jgi:hypothetical protein
MDGRIGGEIGHEINQARSVMTFVRPQRGRPKGSGIDDRARLREIAALITSQPNIKPTTAIRMLGESDPSVIRRLRDKFYAVQHDLMAEMRNRIESAATAPLAGSPAPAVAPARAVALENYESLRRQSVDRPVSGAVEESISRERLIELAAYNVMLSHAIQASILAVQQSKAGEAAIKLPPIAAVLRQQIALGEAIMAMAWPRGAVPEGARIVRPQTL